MRQDQFLEVVSRDEALRRWTEALEDRLRPPEQEIVPLELALGRILAEDLAAPGDVPAFDRSNVDGWAVRAADTYGATEEAPVELRPNEEEIPPGVAPEDEVAAGTATSIATGGMLPRGADAVVMVEDTELADGLLEIRRPVVPGAHVAFAGTDLGKGETVLRAGDRLTARETGVLAACGIARVPVLRRLRVAVLSTGDEIVPPGTELPPGGVHDANARAVADALRELGLEPVTYEPIPDDEEALEAALDEALGTADMVLLSGGTSKGAGDLNHRVLEAREPGVLVHGVALKPGKPLCLGAIGSTPVAILPGFPTSALFTLHDLVVPFLRRWIGLTETSHDVLEARLALRVPSVRGRRHYVLVNLLEGPDGPSAWPLGGGSGSITTWARADGYTVVEVDEEGRRAGEFVPVQLLGRDLRPADLVVVGSHCTGLDLLLGLLRRRGHTAKVLAVGSQAGLEAARRGECDLAPVHLLEPETGRYNEPFVPEGVELVAGYGRLQGVVSRSDDPRFAGAETAEELVEHALADPSIRMVNRQKGSGTRVLLDGLLGAARPPGHAVEARTHNAVAAAVTQARADWGVAIEPVARAYGLTFLPLTEERYDFLVPTSRSTRSAVEAFAELLEEEEVRRRLAEAGFRP